MNFFSTVGALALFGLLTTLDHFGASQISDGEVYGNSTYCGNSTYSNCTITTNSTTSNSSSGGHQSHQLPRPPPPPKPAHIENHFEGKLFSAHGYPYQKFGHRVAANKDHIVVGTSIESLKPQVFVFSKDLEGNSSTAWKEIMFLESGKPSYDGFGLSLAVTNECLVIGAPNDDTWGYKSGKIYICHADPEGRFECRKSFHEEIYASSEMKKGAEYGHSLAISDVHLVVGAPGAIPNNSSIRTQSGLVDVFQKLGPR